MSLGGAPTALTLARALVLVVRVVTSVACEGEGFVQSCHATASLPIQPAPLVSDEAAPLVRGVRGGVAPVERDVR